VTATSISRNQRCALYIGNWFFPYGQFKKIPIVQSQRNTDVNIIKRALFGMEGQTDTAQAAEPDKVAEKTVVMQGSLSTIFSKALNIAYAKKDPLTGEPAVESQAIDYYAAAKASASATHSAPSQSVADDQNLVDVYTNPVQLKCDGTREEIVQVVQELSAHGTPSEFVFVSGAMKPTDDSPVGGSDYNMVEIGRTRPLALEDIESYSVVIKLKPKA